jgi:hypothetical protein
MSDLKSFQINQEFLEELITENVANPAKESSLQAHLYWDSTSILFDPGHHNLKRGYSREEVMTTDALTL